VSRSPTARLSVLLSESRHARDRGQVHILRVVRDALWQSDALQRSGYSVKDRVHRSPEPKVYYAPTTKVEGDIKQRC